MVEAGDTVVHVADRQMPHSSRDHGKVIRIYGTGYDDLALVAWPGGDDKHPKANLTRCTGCPLDSGTVVP